MKFKLLILILLSCVFLQGYRYEYHVPRINAANNAADRNNQGVAYMEMGQYQLAMSEFKLAIALSPNSPASAAYYNNLGIVYKKFGAFSAAEPCFQKAIELNPVFLEYYNNLADLYAQNGSIYSKLNSYNSQISSDRNNSQAYFMAGLLYKRSGDKANATQYFKRYIAIEKENVLSRAAKQMIFEMNNEK